MEICPFHFLQFRLDVAKLYPIRKDIIIENNNGGFWRCYIFSSQYHVCVTLQKYYVCVTLQKYFSIWNRNLPISFPTIAFVCGKNYILSKNDIMNENNNRDFLSCCTLGSQQYHGCVTLKIFLRQMRFITFQSEIPHHSMHMSISISHHLMKQLNHPLEFLYIHAAIIVLLGAILKWNFHFSNNGWYPSFHQREHHYKCCLNMTTVIWKEFLDQLGGLETWSKYCFN